MGTNDKLEDYKWVLNKLSESDLALDKANETIEQQQKEIELLQNKLETVDFAAGIVHEATEKVKHYEQALKDIEYELNRHMVEVSDISEIVQKALNQSEEN